jgi:hypothetical protein
MARKPLKNIPEEKNIVAITLDAFSERPKILPLPSTKTDMIMTQTTNTKFVARI